MCLSSETLAWGIINWGEGARISGTAILQMIPTSSVDASNSYVKETRGQTARVALPWPSWEQGEGEGWE